MKRFISIFVSFVMVFCFVPVFCFAQEYNPEAYEDVFSFDYVGNEYSLSCQRPLSDGSYLVRFSAPDSVSGDVLYYYDEVYLELVPESNLDSGDFYTASFSCNFDSGSSVVLPNKFEISYFPNYSASYASAYSGTSQYFYQSGNALELYPFTPSEDNSLSISQIVSSDMIFGVLDQVVSLLPIILGVLVAYIAIRKGIAFLTDVLRQS